MMGVVRARSRKATVRPREYGPINWYNAPVDLHRQPFRFPWSADFIKKMINSCLRISPDVRPDYKFKFIQMPNHIGGKKLLDHQLRHLDFANVPKWISVAAQIRHCNLSRRMAPLQYEPAGSPQGRVTMSGDIPLPLLDMVNRVLGAEMRAEWDEECLNLEVSNFEDGGKLARSGGKLAGYPSVSPLQPTIGPKKSVLCGTLRRYIADRSWQCR